MWGKILLWTVVIMLVATWLGSNLLYARGPASLVFFKIATMIS
jgi:hypothetical protein